MWVYVDFVMFNFLVFVEVLLNYIILVDFMVMLFGFIVIVIFIVGKK